MQRETPSPVSEAPEAWNLLGVPASYLQGRMMKRLIASLAIGLAVAACGTPAVRPGTGIQGTVLVGPTCPVERINSPCPPHPIAATIVVTDENGTEVTRFHSGADGRFKVDLAPGTYTLVGLTVGSSFLPRPIPTSIIVTQGAYTAVTVQYDSGIR